MLDGEARTAGLPEFEKLPRHGHMVWLSDFLAPVETINRLVARYADAGLKGHLFQVMDPAEESLPFNGRVRFEGFEDESPLLIGRVEGIRDQYIDKLRLHREALRAVTRLAGWSFGIHRTDAAPTQALLGLYRALAKD